MILDGAALGRQLFGEDVDPRELLVRMYPDLARVAPPLDHAVLTARPLVAFVNHGTWIALCDCGAPPSKLPWPGGVVFVDRPLIWCLRCENGPTGRGWRPVTLPSDDARAAIEAALEVRPLVETQNWAPPETVDDLVAENVAHGVVVQEGAS